MGSLLTIFFRVGELPSLGAPHAGRRQLNDGDVRLVFGTYASTLPVPLNDAGGYDVGIHVEQGRIAYADGDEAQRVCTADEGLILSAPAAARSYTPSAGTRVLEVWSPARQHEPRSAQRFALEALAADELRPGTERRMIAVGSSALLFIRYGRPTVSPPHEHVSIIYIAAGKFEVTVGDQTRTLQPGDGAIVPAGFRHGLTTDEPHAAITELWHPYPVS